MPNNIAVSITADVSDLTVKRAVLSAELKAATSDLNTFARTANTSGMTKELQASMLAAADKAQKARAAIALLNREIKDLAAEKGASPFEGVTKGLESIKGAAEQISAVRASIMGVGEAMAAAFAVEGLVDWAKRMGEAGEKTEHTARILGTNVGTVQQLTSAFTMMGVAPDAGVMGVERLDKAFARARAGGKEQEGVFKALGVATAQNYTQMQLLGVVMDGFSKQADGPAKAAEAMMLFGRAGAALIPFLDLGSAGMAQINDLTAKYGAVNEDAVEKSAQLGSAFNENKLAMSGVSNVMAQAFAPALTVLVQGTNDLIASWVASYKAGGAVKLTMDILVGAFKLVIDTVGFLGVIVDFTFKTIDGAAWALAGVMAAAFDDIKGALKIAGDSFAMFGKVAVDALTFNWGAIQGDIRNGLAKISADVQASAHKMGQDAAAGFAKGAKEWQSADQDASGSEAWSKKFWAGKPNAGMKSTGEGPEGDTSADPSGRGKKHKGGGESPMTAMENELRESEFRIRQQTGDWSADMQAMEVKFWQGKLDAAKAGSKLYGEIQTRLEAAQLASGRKTAEENRRIALSDVTTQLDLQKAAIGDKRKAAEEDFKTAKITAAEKASILADLARQEAQVEIDAQEAKKRVYAHDVVAVHEAANQELLILAKLAADLDAIERQRTDDKIKEEKKRTDSEKKAAEEQLKAWRTANNEILSAEDKLVSGIMGGRESLSRILGQIALQTATKEIQAELKAVTERVLLRAEGLSAEQAAEQAAEKGSILFHWLAEGQKTAATAAGATARAGAENTSFFARVGSLLLGSLGLHVATEASKTGATAAGATARSTAEVAKAAFTASAQMPALIALAGAGGVASMAAAPWPIDMGAPAFGAAMATAAGAFSLGSFAKGLDVVPRDMIAQIHEGERILPASDNRALMSAVAGGGAKGGQTVNHNNLTYSPVVTPSGDWRQDLHNHASDVFALLQRGIRDGSLKMA